MSLIWAQSTVKQYIQWIKRILVQKTLNLVRNWWLILLIKPHMSNQIMIRGLSSNLEESIRVYLDHAGKANPPTPMMVKHMYVESARKKSTTQVIKKQLMLWGKSKHVVVNVIIIYVGSICFFICQTCFEKNIKQPHKHCFCIFLSSLNMPRVISFLPCVCIRIFSKKYILVFY